MKNKTQAEWFADNHVSVEVINGWSYHTTTADPADFGAVLGHDADITMFSFSVFPDGSKFAIVPGQVGDAVQTWGGAASEVPNYEDLHSADFELVDTAGEGTCQLWRNINTGMEYVVLADNSVISREEDSATGDAIFPYDNQ